MKKAKKLNPKNQVIKLMLDISGVMTVVASRSFLCLAIECLRGKNIRKQTQEIT